MVGRTDNIENPSMHFERMLILQFHAAVAKKENPAPAGLFLRGARTVLRVQRFWPA